MKLLNRSRLVAAVGMAAALELVSGCSRPVKVQLASTPKSATWNMRLIGYSEPPVVMLAEHAAGMPMVSARKPDKGKKWVAVVLAMVAPERQADGQLPGLSLDEIRLEVPDKTSFPAIAVATGGVFEDSSRKSIPEYATPQNADLRVEDKEGKGRFAISTGGVWFYNRDPEQVGFLFSVPAGSGEMLLRF
jgi:hypothetical protein